MIEFIGHLIARGMERQRIGELSRICKTQARVVSFRLSANIPEFFTASDAAAMLSLAARCDLALKARL